MASSRKISTPLTFDLPVSLIKEIETARKLNGLKSASETVRLALARFNFDKFEPNHEKHTQISVRIPGADRAKLKRVAKQKKASVGELIRAAIENLQGPRARAVKK